MGIKIYNNLLSFIMRTLDNSKEFKSLLRNSFVSIPSIQWTNISITTQYLCDYT